MERKGKNRRLFSLYFFLVFLLCRTNRFRLTVAGGDAGLFYSYYLCQTGRASQQTNSKRVFDVFALRCVFQATRTVRATETRTTMAGERGVDEPIE